MQYNIMSFDGGGVLGVVAARMLQRLDKECPEFLSKINLFSGTSTGGLIALSLANGFTPTDIVSFYRNRSKEIFHQSFWRKISFNLFIAKYSNTALQNVISDLFGKKKLADLPGKVLISAFTLAEEDSGRLTYKPKFFTNLDGNKADALASVADIALYTTSAPTYFSSYKGYIDGGVSCNSPSVAAIAQSLNPNSSPNPSLSEINLLSFGTGKFDQYIRGKNNDWGLVNWALKFVDVVLSSDWAIADYQCEQFLNDRYRRVNPILDQNYAIDDATAVDRIIECVDRVNIEEDIKWIKANLASSAILWS